MHYLNAGYNVRYKVAESFSYIFVFLAKFLCGIRYEVIGIEKLPKNGKPHIVLANHQSFWENLFLQLIIPKHSWVIKEELFDIPIFGWCLRTVKPIAVDRSNSRSVVQILNEGQKKIEEGLSIIMFPEATRVKIDKNVKFKPSAAKLAMSTSVPIILIAHNAGVCWPKGFWFRKPGLISVKILEVIAVEKYEDYDVRTLTDYIQDRINKEKEILVRKVEEDYLYDE
jgi:1-acyl-sn-glycerol-3-phosphate acyltransferase